MAVKIVGVGYKAVWKKEPKLLEAIADFGDGEHHRIPLPAHFFLADADRTTLETEAARGMESLATALLKYARRTQK